MTILHKLSENIGGRNASQLILEVNITLILKLDNGTTRKENQRPISFMNTVAKFSVKY